MMKPDMGKVCRLRQGHKSLGAYLVGKNYVHLNVFDILQPLWLTMGHEYNKKKCSLSTHTPSILRGAVVGAGSSLL